MGLIAGLVDHIEAVFVGQVQVFVHGRIVRGADRVEIELLEDFHVAADDFLRHGVAQGRMLHVGALRTHFHGLSVQVEDTVPDLRLLEADALVHFVHDLAGRIRENKVQPVEDRGLRRPFLRSFHLCGQVHRLETIRADGDGAAVHLRDVLSIPGNGRFHLVSTPLHVKTAQTDGNTQVRIHEIGSEVRDDLPVPDPGLRGGEKRHVVKDARQPPVILAFQVITVAVLEHQHRQGVLPGLEVFRHIIFRGLLGAFVIAHFLPVDPHERGRCDLFETQEHLLPLPVLGQVESGPVGTRGIVFGNFRNAHRERRRRNAATQTGKEETPGALRQVRILEGRQEALPRLLGRQQRERRGDIAEDGLAVPLHLPVGRDFDGPPLPVVEGRLEEIRRDLRRAFEIAELPGAVQGQGLFRKMERPSGLLVLLEDGRILDVIGNPVQIRLGAGRQRQRKQAEGQGLSHGRYTHNLLKYTYSVLVLQTKSPAA